MHRFTIKSIAAAALLICGSGLFHAQLHAQPAAGNRNEPITLNFTNADIEAVARTMAVTTGRNIVVDPRVKGTINLVTDKPVTPAAAYNQFLATLRLSGFTVVDVGGLLKVVPEADAKLQGGTVSVAGTGPAQANNSLIVTQIFRLNYENPNNLVPILRPLIAPNNTINVNPGNNSLIITDYADNLTRLGRIIAALDVSNATDVEIIPLKHALASDLAPLVSRLAESGGSGAPGGDASFRTTIIAEPRSNTLITRAANPARMALVRSLVEKLDQPTSQSATGNIYVVYLKNADAAKLAVTLRAALQGGNTAAAAPTASAPAVAVALGGGAPATAPIAASAAPSTGGQIQADPATNSLIITAAEPQYRQLRAVIDKLDARRAQVFVESLIAEVNADKAAEFGIQWQGVSGKNGDSAIGILGTNFSIAGQNILSLATGAASGAALPSTGGNFAIANRTNGIYVLGFLARFLQTKGDGNILSTPNLLTLDNEEAKIVIGQNVPFVTGSFTNTGASGGGTVNPFQTVERKDVGITLRVKPQISENGTIKLQIFQEISSVQSNSAAGLITAKRSIESNVLVDDGGIIVLGGLLQDEYSDLQEKIPGIGDVPIIGNLFKSETRSRKKTNLMIFLRPVVMRDANATETLSMDRYDLIRNQQLGQQPASSVMIPINEAPALPNRPVSPTDAAKPARKAPEAP
jgi:general secretion pathway protein D